MAGSANLRIRVSAPDLSEKERVYLLNAFDSSWISSQGAYVDRFERAFAEFAGVREAITCVNGTAALHLAMLATGIGPGHEVILPDLTYVATANAVRYVGATPVLADCDPRTWTLDPASVERLITPATRAIVAVHLFGMPCDLGALSKLANRHNLALIEDASQAHGAVYRGEPVGSWGDVATFSFYGNKILTTGEGGMVCTDDPELASQVRKLRGQGVDPKRAYWFDEVGYNYRMTNPACAIGLAQLERFDELRAKREQVRQAYVEKIARAELPLKLQEATPSSHTVVWMVGAVVDELAPLNREELTASLAGSGIETRPFFHPIHTLPPYADAQTDNGCPVSTRLGARGIMLPTHTGLSSKQIDDVVGAIATAMIQPVTGS